MRSVCGSGSGQGCVSEKKHGAVDARELSKQFSFVRDKNRWAIHFKGSPSNFQKPIPESDYQLILEKLAEPPIDYRLKSPDHTSELPQKHGKAQDLRYIPPIVSDMPKVARENPLELEQQLWVLGKMLGYDVEQLGHKAAGA